jgi:hypothetical protein
MAIVRGATWVTRHSLSTPEERANDFRIARKVSLSLSLAKDEKLYLGLHEDFLLIYGAFSFLYKSD